MRQLQAAFAAAWTEATGVLFTGRATLDAQENGATAAALLHTSPTLGSTAAERFYALSIAGARKALYVTNSYFAPDEHFIELLAAAARRGVDVRILTAGPLTDVNIVRFCGTRLVQHSARGRRARLRMATDDAPRQDVRGRRPLVDSRIDELRKSIYGTQRRVDAGGVRSLDRRGDEPGLSERSPVQPRDHYCNIRSTVMARATAGARREHDHQTALATRESSETS